MTWVSLAAMYFVFWWLTLFAILPFGLKTQDDDRDVTLGTEASAPRGPHMLRAMLWTTVVTAVVIGAFYFVTKGLGYGFDDFPQFIPEIN
ncbi:DUF1467 family protein [Aminobacter sp. SR38]|jgi:predicted secreted protein|uniref:DUF1467 family protein n=1 Tax=Aminobacter sp. SR38 TaxID=2774562 RepID=UPI001782C316|nr:DUF1467 family protein [Aminobacter sp. SR38]QOF71092.1 DUF1467 family protein [Aminobacter sp. SR38]